LKPDFSMPGVELYRGDCLEILPTLLEKSVDMIFTDPPYGHKNNDGDLIANWEKALGRAEEGVEYEARPIANDGPEADDLFQFMVREADRLLASGGCCCCCCGGGGPDPMFARWSLWMDKALEFKQMVVWDKGPIGMGWHYRRSYETVLVAQKRGGPCKWYDTTHRVENIIRPKQWGKSKIIPRANQHPTEKPTWLPAHFIALHTQPGETVLDPFMGNGGAGEAALKMGRKFIGIEIDPKYFEIAKRRIANAAPLFAQAEGAKEGRP